jgi:hypothetical protein
MAKIGHAKGFGVIVHNDLLLLMRLG